MDFQAIVSGSEETVRALVQFLTSGIAVFLGVVFIFSGLRKVIAHAKGERQGQATVGPVLINLLIGSILVQLSYMTDTLVETIFGSSRESPNAAMQYMPSQVQESEVLTQAVQAGVLWVFAIGFISIIRGLVLWNDMAKGQGHGQSVGWKGFWHIFFGGLAVNISGTLSLFGGG